MLTYAPRIGHLRSPHIHSARYGFPFPSLTEALQNCNGRSTPTISLNGFAEFLQRTLRNKEDIAYLLRKANEHQDILTTGNASPLLALTTDVRRNTMRALAHLAKFNGIHKRWKEIIEQYGLHWKETNDSFELFSKTNVNEMIQYVKDVRKILPTHSANTFTFATLTGLRASEACESIRLIKQNTQGYYNTELQILEHHRFKNEFIRRSKKCYISIVNDDILNIAKNANDSYNSIQCYLKKKKTRCNIAYGRKIFATWLVSHGIEREFVDLLQGRTPTSIFARHYYRPDFAQYANKIKELLKQLQTEIEA